MKCICYNISFMYNKLIKHVLACASVVYVFTNNICNDPKLLQLC